MTRKRGVCVLTDTPRIAINRQIGNIGNHSKVILTMEQLPAPVAAVAAVVERELAAGRQTMDVIEGMDNYVYTRTPDGNWLRQPVRKHVTATPEKPVIKQRKSELDLYWESEWCNGLAVEGACRAIRAKRISSAMTRSVLMILAESSHRDEDGLYRVELPQTRIAAVLGVKQSTVSKAIKHLKDAGIIRPVNDGSYTVGTDTKTGKAIRYELLFSIRG